MIEPLEMEIERAWTAMLTTRRVRRMFLTKRGKITWDERKGERDGLHEVGYFTRSISLADFREQVFYSFDQLVSGVRRGR
jgi:hypothetical protein